MCITPGHYTRGAGPHRPGLAANEKALLLQPEHPGAAELPVAMVAPERRLPARLARVRMAWRIRGVSPRRLPQPLWDGSPLDRAPSWSTRSRRWGTRFSSFVICPLSMCGGRVVMECQAPLESLLRNCPGIDELIVRGSPLPECDVQAPLLSLPAILGTTLATVPANVPYRSADDKLVQRLAWRVAWFGFKIGIAWQGNPGFPGIGCDRSPCAVRPAGPHSRSTVLFAAEGPGVRTTSRAASSIPVTDLGPRRTPAARSSTPPLS